MTDFVTAGSGNASSQQSSLFQAPYTVVRHDHIDAEFAQVTVRCLGYDTHGTQPADWAFVLKVPKIELAKWPLGGGVRLAVTV